MKPTSNSPLNRIAIVGRPNVGKSTLFNRMISRKRSLVHDLPGVTRDRIVENTTWIVGGKHYPIELTDTGGLGGGTFEQEISMQVELALQGAQVVLLIVDGREGLTEEDRMVVQRLRKAHVLDRALVFGVVNKIDNENLQTTEGDFYTLGIKHWAPVSAEHNRGVENLKDELVEVGKFTALAEEGHLDEAPPEELPKIAVVGRPNVGKSTLLNAILGEERMITSAIAGTTSDAVDVEGHIEGHTFMFIDTAGIRKKSKTEQGVEVLSVVQTKKALERADAAILVLDGEKGMIEQDEKIGGMIEESGTSVIMVVNKWDTQVNNQKFTREEAAKRIRAQIRFLKYAPMTFISARENQGIEGLGELLADVIAQRSIKLQTKELTDWIREESEIHNPMNAKFYFVHQTGRHPPTFSCHVNDPRKINFSLKRHLVNAMRKKWGFMGTPIRLNFVKSENT